MMRTAALGISAVGLLLLAACAHEPRGDRAGTTATTSAELASSSLKTPTGCSADLPHALEFDGTSTELSADERVEAQSWANCLNTTEMKDATVVLLGSSHGRHHEDDSLFQRRAAAVRDELVKRGVERSRVLVGRPNVAREGGKLGPTNTVLVEVSHSRALRDMDERR